MHFTSIYQILWSQEDLHVDLEHRARGGDIEVGQHDRAHDSEHADWSRACRVGQPHVRAACGQQRGVLALGEPIPEKEE